MCTHFLHAIQSLLIHTPQSNGRDVIVVLNIRVSFDMQRDTEVMVELIKAKADVLAN